MWSIIQNLRSYVEGGGVLVIAGLFLLLKVRSAQVGKLTVEKLLSDSRGELDLINAKLAESQTKLADAQKEYHVQAHISVDPDSK